MKLEALVHYFSQKGPIVLLDSQSADHPASQKSYLAALPVAIIKSRDNEISITEYGEEKYYSGNPWQALQEFRQRHNSWLFGYLGYDLKNHMEKLKSKNDDLVKAPDLFFMVPGFLLEIDQKSGNMEVLVGEMPAESEYELFSGNFAIGKLNYQIPRADYLKMIEKAQEHIREGDFYEINLSHQMHARFKGQAFELYKRMKKVGPVPFGSFVQLEDVVICSQSPERFLCKKDNTLISQPIKGTCRRGGTIEEDNMLKKQLQECSKERAENLMIVDLVRNDMSRIAESGSVTVPELFSIQTFDTVHQMVSTVKAEPANVDPVKILQVCFPMGSMTGAPKISAMKTIEKLENYRRGIYSGAIGYMTPQGDFDFNVVIRTAIIRGNDLYYSVGGAITSDSVPQKEWEETCLKAGALLEV